MLRYVPIRTSSMVLHSLRCLCKAGGIAYMEEPPSDYTGRSGDTHLLESRRQIHGNSQIFLQTLTHYSLTLKAKANQRFHFTLANMGWKFCTIHQHEAPSQLHKVTSQTLLLDFQMCQATVQALITQKLCKSQQGWLISSIRHKLHW